jgi:hypothetical protein
MLNNDDNIRFDIHRRYNLFCGFVDHQRAESIARYACTTRGDNRGAKPLACEGLALL